MRKKKLYVIGRDKEVEVWGNSTINILRPLTATQAKEKLKDFPNEYIVYKLVPVKEEELK